MLRATIRINNTSKGIIGLLRNLLKRRANSEPIILASSLVARKTSSEIQTMPKINLLTCLHKMYTQFGTLSIPYDPDELVSVQNVNGVLDREVS